MSTIKDAHGWFTTVSSGSGPYTMPPSGPWYGRDAALAAMEGWRGRAGYLAGTIAAAHSVAVVGPFRSRAEARAADISDYGQRLRHRRPS